MARIPKVVEAFQHLFGKGTEAAAEKSEVIVRKRVFTASGLLQTFILGFLKNPKASDEDLAQMAAKCDCPVTPQAIE